MTEKRCTKCLDVKPIDEFGLDRRYFGGHRNWCGQCCKEYRAKAYLKNKGKCNSQASEWHKANKENVSARVKAYYQKNKASILARQSEAKRNSPDKYREANRIYRAKRLATDPATRIRSRISAQLSYCIPQGKGGRATMELIGYHPKDLRNHLERQFLKGMSFDNFGDWHIDHIIPVSSFNLLDPDEVKQAWALPNLRPIWAKDNLKKGAKMEFLL